MNNERFPNPSKLTIALIEAFVKPFIGEKAIEVIKEPLARKELLEKLSSALTRAEESFVVEYSAKDRDVCDLIKSLPIIVNDELQVAFWSFYQNPADLTFQQFLTLKIQEQYHISHERATDAIRTYLEALKYELVPLNSEIREKITTITGLEIAKDTAINKINIQKIADVLTRQEDTLTVDDQMVLDDYLRTLITRNYFEKQGRVLSDGSSKSIALETIYIPLRSTSLLPDTDQRIRDEEIQIRIAEGQRAKFEIAEEIDKTLAERQVAMLKLRDDANTQLKVENILSVLPTKQKCVILGEPGSGKSTLLQYLTLQHATAASNQFVELWGQLVDENNVPKAPMPVESGKIQIPLSARIANYAEAIRRDPELSLFDYFVYHHPKEMGFPHPSERLRKIMKWALLKGCCIILLDGLDEIIKTDDRLNLARKITEFSQIYSKPIVPSNRHHIQQSSIGTNQFIVSSRIAGYHEARLGHGFETQTLMPLDDEEMKLFIDRWFASSDLDPIQLDRRSDLSEQLFSSIVQTPNIYRLARSPLLLHLLATLFIKNNSLPRRRVDLYEDVVSFLLTEWNHHRGVNVRQLYDPEVAEKILEVMAEWLHKNRPTGLIAEHEFVRVLGEISPVPAQEFVDNVRQGSGILVILERGQNLYGFMHLTFEEYFAGRYWARNLSFQDFKKTIKAHLHQPRWREPILLAIGYFHRFVSQGEKTPELMETILDNGSRYEDVLHRDLLFVTDCVIENQIEDAPIVTTLTQRLIDIYCDRNGQGRYNHLMFQVKKALRQLLEFQQAFVEQVILARLDTSTQPIVTTRLLELLGELELYSLDVAYLIERKQEDIPLSAELNKLMMEIRRQNPKANVLQMGWQGLAEKESLQKMMGILWIKDEFNVLPELLDLPSDTFNESESVQAVGRAILVKAASMASLAPLFNSISRVMDQHLEGLNPGQLREEIIHDILLSLKKKLLKSLKDANDGVAYQEIVRFSIKYFSLDKLFLQDISAILAKDLEQKGKRSRWVLIVLGGVEVWDLLNEFAFHKDALQQMLDDRELGPLAFDLLAAQEISPDLLGNMWRILSLPQHSMAAQVKRYVTAGFSVPLSVSLLYQLNIGFKNDDTRAMALKILYLSEISKLDAESENYQDICSYLLHWITSGGADIRSAAVIVFLDVMNKRNLASIHSIVFSIAASLSGHKDGESEVPYPELSKNNPFSTGRTQILPIEISEYLVSPDRSLRANAITEILRNDIDLFLLGSLMDGVVSSDDHIRAESRYWLYRFCEGIETDGSTMAPEWLSRRSYLAEGAVERTIYATACGKIKHTSTFWLERWMDALLTIPDDYLFAQFCLDSISNCSDSVKDFLQKKIQDSGVPVDIRMTLSEILQRASRLNDLGRLSLLGDTSEKDFSLAQLYLDLPNHLKELEKALDGNDVRLQDDYLKIAEAFSRLYQPINVFFSVNVDSSLKQKAISDLKRFGLPNIDLDALGEDVLAILADTSEDAETLFSDEFASNLVSTLNDPDQRKQSSSEDVYRDGYFLTYFIRNRKKIADQFTDIICRAKDGLSLQSQYSANRALVYLCYPDRFDDLVERIENPVDLLWALLEVAAVDLQEMADSENAENTGLYTDVPYFVSEWLQSKQGSDIRPSRTFKLLRDALMDELDLCLKQIEGNDIHELRIGNSWATRQIILHVLSLLADWRITPLFDERPDLPSLLTRAGRDINNYEVRRLALHILGYTQTLTTEIATLLFDACKDTEMVRDEAISSIGEYKNFSSESIDILVNALNSPSNTIKSNAVDLIDALGCSRSEDLGIQGRNRLGDAIYTTLFNSSAIQKYSGYKLRLPNPPSEYIYDHLYAALICVISGVSTQELDENTTYSETIVTQATSVYISGDDLFDDSFSIDSTSGEFLGEYGVGISDTIESNGGKHVTAFEVWMFDKNDIKTSTKVLLSSWAYHDLSTRSRLEPKGEVCFLKHGLHIKQNTLTLDMDLKVTEMEYSKNTKFPMNSVIEKITFEIAIRQINQQ